MHCSCQQITENQTSRFIKKVIQLIMERMEKQSFGEFFKLLFNVVQTLTGTIKLYILEPSTESI